MNKATVAIVDRGRGPQLSTSRITVQDVFPYLKQNWGRHQILEAMPVLTMDELLVIESYVQTHLEEVQEVDRRIEARNAARTQSPEQAELERQARLQRLKMARIEILKALQEKACDSVAC